MRPSAYRYFTVLGILLLGACDDATSPTVVTGTSTAAAGTAAGGTPIGGSATSGSSGTPGATLEGGIAGDSNAAGGANGGTGSGGEAGAPDTDAGGDTDAGSLVVELTDVFPTAGCGEAPPVGTGPFTIETMGTKAADCLDAECGPWTSNREYSIFLPQGYDPNTAYPLVFEGPGCGGGSENIYTYDDNANNTVIRVGLKPSAEIQAIHATNPGSSCFDDRDGDNSVDWVFYENLYDALASSLCFDRNRVFAGGNSSGSVLANELGCKYAGDALRPIRGIMPHSGTLPAEPQQAPTCTTAPMAGMWIHTTGDTIYPFADTVPAINRAMALNDCTFGATYDTATLINYPIGGGQPQDTCKQIVGCDVLYPLVVCLLAGGGHGGSSDSVVNPGVSTFLRSFLAPPLAAP